MKKILFVSVVVMFMLRVWLGAERRASTVDMNLVTSFSFSTYPACGAGRTSYCIQAFRFYDADSKARLAEVSAMGMRGTPRIVGSVRLNSVPRRVYVVTVYPDDHGVLEQGPAGNVRTFDDAGH